MKKSHLVNIFAEIIYHTCDDNGNYLLNTEEEAGATSIHSINATYYISINDDETSIHKCYAPIASSNTHEDLSSESEYDSEKQTVRRHKNILLGLLLNKSKSFLWQI